MLELLKSRNKAIGIKQTLRAVENDAAGKVYIARDADEKVTGKLKEYCLSKAVEIEYVDTMKQRETAGLLALGGLPAEGIKAQARFATRE